jgi:hypothetical protein
MTLCFEYFIGGGGVQVECFHTKNTSLGVFWRALELEKVLYFIGIFMTIWYILCFWYVVQRKMWELGLSIARFTCFGVIFYVVRD